MLLPPARSTGGPRATAYARAVDPAIVERYLLLGLRLGRHVEGIVDAYYGPASLAAAVAAEGRADPRALVGAAETLLEELEDGWLRDQVVGLRTYAGVLAGESLAYADEVEGCYGVRPLRTDEALLAAAHDRLQELLPGGGTLGERRERWEDSLRVSDELMERTIAAVVEEARAWTRRLIALPHGEGVELEIVRDVPWMAFCAYGGELRSRISVNAALPLSAPGLLVLALHETYPGHHAERCCKEELLVRGRGLLEETLVLVPTPQSLVSEGIASIAPELLLESEAGAALAALVQEAGVELDLEEALALKRALEPLGWVGVNAALMLHEDGATESETRAYAERWGLETPEMSAHLVRFLREPTSRSYILTYEAGRDLARSYVAGDPERFRRLLTEQIRVGDLLAPGDAPHAPAG